MGLVSSKYLDINYLYKEFIRRIDDLNGTNVLIFNYNTKQMPLI